MRRWEIGLWGEYKSCEIETGQGGKCDLVIAWVPGVAVGLWWGERRRRRRRGGGGGGVYTGGWGGDSNADFHSSNPGATKGKQGEDGVKVEDGEKSNLRVVRVRIEVPSD